DLRGHCVRPAVSSAPTKPSRAAGVFKDRDVRPILWNARRKRHVNKLIGAAALAVLALFMLVGFVNSGRDLGAPATLAALAITVALPAAGAALLARGHFTEKSRISGRKAELRRNTMDAEILRLAGQHGGRLTAVEVATALAVPPEAAAEALAGLGI